MDKVNQIISNCSLCTDRALHIMGDMQQCISCGYVSSDKFLFEGKFEDTDNVEYNNLTADMKSWVKVNECRIWIPTIMTLPVGMLYPIDVEEVVGDGTITVMKWAFAEMADIPEEEQKDYPVEGGDGYYKQKYDVDNKLVYDEFYQGMHVINERMKEKADELGLKDMKLPKLKKL